MIFGEQIYNFHRLMPEIVLCFFGIIVMMADPFVGPTKKKTLGWIAFIGALLALGSLHLAAQTQGLGYSGLFSDDLFSLENELAGSIARPLRIATR